MLFYIEKIPKFVGGTKNEPEEAATSLGTPQASQGFSTKVLMIFSCRTTYFLITMVMVAIATVIQVIYLLLQGNVLVGVFTIADTLNMQV